MKGVGTLLNLIFIALCELYEPVQPCILLHTCNMKEGRNKSNCTHVALMNVCVDGNHIKTV